VISGASLMISTHLEGLQLQHRTPIKGKEKLRWDPPRLCFCQEQNPLLPGIGKYNSLGRGIKEKEFSI